MTKIPAGMDPAGIRDEACVPRNTWLPRSIVIVLPIKVKIVVASGGSSRISGYIPPRINFCSPAMASNDGHAQEIKVFWFFSSEKNIYYSSAFS